MAEAQRTTLVVHAIVKGYHECPFEVELGDKFSLNRKRGDRGKALKVIDGRGQLGHIQKELVGPLWPIERFSYEWETDRTVLDRTVTVSVP